MNPVFLRPMRSLPALLSGRVLAPALLVLALCLIVAGPAIAWSALGHKLVAELAQRRLNPAANAEVKRLLAGEADPTLAGIATWADALRDTDPERFRQTARWHYVNFPGGECHYVPQRDCKDGHCVIAAIQAQRKILADRRQSPQARRDALKFIVHFVADVHQPLHASHRRDKGGNRHQISLRTDIEPEAYARRHYVDGVMGTNLHSVWDYYILADARLGLRDYAKRLDRQPWPPVTERSAATPAQWAAESCRLIDARQLYPKGQAPHRMDRVYLDSQRALAEQRIRIAAYRLAQLLNETIGR